MAQAYEVQVMHRGDVVDRAFVETETLARMFSRQLRKKDIRCRLVACFDACSDAQIVNADNVYDMAEIFIEAWK
jgi:hypothetical protein